MADNKTHSTKPTPNTLKRNSGPTKPIDTTPTSEPLAEHPETGNEKPQPVIVDDDNE